MDIVQQFEVNSPEYYQINNPFTAHLIFSKFTKKKISFIHK